QAQVKGAQHGKTPAFAGTELLLLLPFLRILTALGFRRPRSVLIQQRLALRLIEPQVLPRLLNVSSLKVVDRELQFILQPNLAVLYRPPIRAHDPRDFVNAIHILKESRDALHAVGQFHRNWVKVDAAALLEVGELRDLEAVEHDLPADAPRTQRWRLPVVLFELDVVF